MKTTNRRNHWINKTFISLLFLIFLIACSNENPSLETVNEFLKQNPKYGSNYGTSDKPDWAEGKRIEVRTNTGNYLFYLSNNEVVGIWKYEEDGTRTQLFKKEITQPEVQTTKDESLPHYKILFQVKLMSGTGEYGEILIQSYSKATPTEEREKTLRKIIKKEGFVSAALYSTEDAYKANSSESFSKANPNALKNGYLGQITEQGIFIE